MTKRETREENEKKAERKQTRNSINERREPRSEVEHLLTYTRSRLPTWKRKSTSRCPAHTGIHQNPSLFQNISVHSMLTSCISSNRRWLSFHSVTIGTTISLRERVVEGSTETWERENNGVTNVLGCNLGHEETTNWEGIPTPIFFTVIWSRHVVYL